MALSGGAYAAQFLLDYVLVEHGTAGLLQKWLALDGASIAAGHYWAFLTYSLLHASPLHLLASGVLLYFGGKEVEPIIGARNFVVLYVAATAIGGFAHWLAMPEVTLLGITPAVAAVIIAFTTILPELDVTVNLFFVLPLRLRAKYLAVALLAVAGILWTVPSLPEIGPVAMLAASAVAWVYVKQLGFGNPLAIQRYIFNRRQRAARIERMNADQFISAEIDPILDKIAREGMHSLSRSERKLLEQGREKIDGKPERK